MTPMNSHRCESIKVPCCSHFLSETAFLHVAEEHLSVKHSPNKITYNRWEQEILKPGHMGRVDLFEASAAKWIMM